MPSGAAITPASRSCTYLRNTGSATSLATFDRRARRSACHCAVVARYSNPPLRVAALRRSSREIVDAARPAWRAISRTPQPLAFRIAISSRLRPRGSVPTAQPGRSIACRHSHETTGRQPRATRLQPCSLDSPVSDRRPEPLPILTPRRSGATRRPHRRSPCPVRPTPPRLPHSNSSSSRRCNDHLNPPIGMRDAATTPWRRCQTAAATSTGSRTAAPGRCGGRGRPRRARGWVMRAGR